MAWIESHQELARHPKTKRLARALSDTVPSVIGRLHLLWWWCLDYAQEGNLARHDPADIADAMMWEGDPQILLTALMATGPDGSAGFLNPDCTIHDWDNYGGKLIRQRQANIERAQKSKELRAGCAQPEQELRAGCGATVHDMTVHESTEQNHDSASPPKNGREKPAPKAKPEKPREDQAMFGAFARGLQVDASKLTESARGKWNKGIQQLLSVGSTAVEVPFLIGTYQRKFPRMDCNPAAIAAHYHELHPGREKYVPPPDAPANEPEQSGNGYDGLYCPFCKLPTDGPFGNRCECDSEEHDAMREERVATLGRWGYTKAELAEVKA